MGRVLVVEKHPVETSGSKHQIQIPNEAFAKFFAGRNATLPANIYNPATAPASSPRPAKIRAYTNSTNRINGVLDIGKIDHALVFVEEQLGTGAIRYDLWWYPDPLATQIIRRWSGNWKRAKRSQHGPGRLWTMLASIPSRDYSKWGNVPFTFLP